MAKPLTRNEELVLEAIRAGRSDFTGISARGSGHWQKGPNGYTFRVVDRALQSLRRRGIIRYDRQKGWRLTTNG